jgi:iron complex transport system substrate-binding protein
VYALGAGSEVVGVSHECDFPPAVRGLPALTRPKIRIDRTSGEIDQSVRALVARGLGVYEIDADGLAAAAPDVIVTQDQCDVCAVSYADVVAAARRVLGTDAAIVSLAPNTLADVWRDIAAVGAALQREAAAAALVADMQDRLASIRAATHGRARPVTACIEWLEPLMTAGNWMPELVEIAGGTDPFATPGTMSRTITWTTLVDAAPEVVVLMPCGFTIAQTRRELAAVTARPEWRALPAVRAGRAAVADGNAYFNRPGPRLVESASILARLLHPAAPLDGVPDEAYEPLTPPKRPNTQ